MTLKSEYEKEKNLRLQDAGQIENASGYTNSYLKHGSACDGSARASVRMEWVRQAERVFLEEYEKDILKLAAKLCRDSVGE